MGFNSEFKGLMLAPIFVRISKIKFYERFFTRFVTYLTDGRTILRTRRFYAIDLP